MDNITAATGLAVISATYKARGGAIPKGIKTYAIEKYVEIYNFAVTITNDFLKNYEESLENGDTLKQAVEQASGVATAA